MQTVGERHERYLWRRKSVSKRMCSFDESYLDVIWFNEMIVIMFNLQIQFLRDKKNDK